MSSDDSVRLIPTTPCKGQVILLDLCMFCDPNPYFGLKASLSALTELDYQEGIPAHDPVHLDLAHL